MTSVNRETVLAAYEDVRNDTSDTMWATFCYSEEGITHGKSGTSYAQFLEDLSDDERLFAFIRMTTGDELSKRAKFVLITWIGENISPMQRAKMSMDKMKVKEIVQNIAVELQVSELDEISEKEVMDAVAKAGGANYGTGVRD